MAARKAISHGVIQKRTLSLTRQNDAILEEQTTLLGSRTCVGRARGRALPPGVRNANEACRPRSRPRGRVCASAERRGEPRVCTGLRVQETRRQTSAETLVVNFDGSKTLFPQNVRKLSCGRSARGRPVGRSLDARASARHRAVLSGVARRPLHSPTRTSRVDAMASRARILALRLCGEKWRVFPFAPPTPARDPPDAPIRGVRVETTAPTPLPPTLRHPQGVPRARGG